MLITLFSQGRLGFDRLISSCVLNPTKSWIHIVVTHAAAVKVEVCSTRYLLLPKSELFLLLENDAEDAAPTRAQDRERGTMPLLAAVATSTLLSD